MRINNLHHIKREFRCQPPDLAHLLQ